MGLDQVLGRNGDGVGDTRVPSATGSKATEGAETGSSHPQRSGPRHYILENQLPNRIRILGASGQSIFLAPFERREVSSDALASFDLPLLRASEDVRLTDRSEEEPFGLVLAGLWPFFAGVYWVAGTWLDRAWFWMGFPAILLLVLLAWWFKNQRGATEILRWTKQAVSLGLVAAFAVGFPAVAILYYAQPFPRAGTGILGIDFSASPADLVGRLMQLVFISLAALLPALMYFVFDREQLGTLRARFVQQVFRLDSSLERLSDLRAKYGAQMEEMYGTAAASRARLLAGRLSPILMATMLLTLGWTLALLNPEVGLGEGGNTFLVLFEPTPTPFVFGFLGAYFFAILLVLRSYLRGDLRPKSYGHICVRVLIVAILSWVLQAVWGSDGRPMLAFVFLAGIVPDTAVRWIKEVARGVGGMKLLKDDSNMGDPIPLSLLEGIDLYDLTRLGDEGITNIEALAHHELVDLMLKTRIPAPRLIDWVDQAILFLHTSADRWSRKAPDRESLLLERLKQSGVRTATDFLAACGAMSRIERKEFASHLNLASELTLQIILRTIEDDEWLSEIRHWREPDDSGRIAIVHAEPVPGGSDLDDDRQDYRAAARALPDEAP